MDIAVTGANGYVGSALCRHLARQGHHVVALTRRPFTTSDISLTNRVSQDFSNPALLSEQLTGCEAVVHLAARTHSDTDNSPETLADYRLANVTTTEALVKASSHAGVKRFIYISSIKVNGERTEGQPFTAQCAPQPQDAYGITKYEAEQRAAALCQDLGLELTIIRPPLIHGQGAKGNLARLSGAIDRGLPLPLGGINNKRDLIALPNLCDLIATCVVHPNAAGQTFLAADGRSLSTPEIIKLLASQSPRKARLLPCPTGTVKVLAKILGRSAQIQRLLGDLEIDIQHTCDTLDWRPKPLSQLATSNT